MPECNVSEKECRLITESTNKQLARDEARLNEHSKNLDDLTIISAKLTMLVELQGKIIDEHTTKIFNAAKTVPWFESKLGEYIVKSFILLLFMLVAAAVGLNALDTIQTIQGGK